MKKIAFSTLSAIALSTAAFAGQPMADYSKDKVIMPEPCINDMELQLDVFGSYTDLRGGGDGFGGGLALNYFFSRFVGVGVEGNVFEADGDARWDYGGRLLVRYPVDSLCLVPYAFVAGGAVSGGGDTEGTIGVGGGLEYRVIAQKLGIFAEGRYTWTGGGGDNNNDRDNGGDGAQIRAGVRVVF